MTLNYQLESSHVADYELYSLPGVGYPLRGPQWPLKAASPQISFLGAAQTFGAFCKYPFANLLGENLSARVLNLGRGGAGPGYFLKQKAILDYVNSSSCCVVQIMSARSSVENEYMSSIDGLTRVHVRKGALAGQEMLGHHAYVSLAKELTQDAFYQLVQQTRDTYISQFAELASQITVPKVLLYVGRNPPLREIVKGQEWTIPEIVGDHPHMISEQVVSELSQLFDHSVIVHDAAGFDNRMVNRFSGEYVSIKRSATYTITKHNAYISPYLHSKAAMQLYEPVRSCLDQNAR